jgi:hypothetical protein
VNDEFEAFAEANGITLKVITKMNLDMIKEQGCRVSFMSNGFDGGRCPNTNFKKSDGGYK